MASTPSFTFFCYYLLLVHLLVVFFFQQVSWCSQLPATCLVFQCPLQFLVSNLHIGWVTVGCLLCSSEDRLGVSPMHREKWTQLPSVLLPSSSVHLLPRGSFPVCPMRRSCSGSSVVFFEGDVPCVTIESVCRAGGEVSIPSATTPVPLFSREI